MRIISLKPWQTEYKVGVLVAADRLNPQATNAFLKTLEEPPPKSLLILTSTEPERLLETLLSRCLRLNFGGERGAISAEQQSWLSSFADLAVVGQKGLLPRYKLLNVLLDRLADLKKEVETRLNASSMLAQYDDAEPKLRERWEDELAAALEAEYRRRRAELLSGFEYWLRDVWLNTLGVDDELLSFPKLAATSQLVAKRISPSDAARNLTTIEETQSLLASNVQETLALEVGLLKLKL